MLEPKDIDVIILCGGRGERLHSILRGLPKPMAEFSGRVFLDILIDYAAGFGFRRFILCAGYKADIIRKYYQRKKAQREIIISEEKTALGTAGALRNASRLIRSSTFLVMNGDSLCRVNLKKFIAFHLEKHSLLSIALTSIQDKRDYGNVLLDKSNRITAFIEKPKNRGEYLINAGVYLFQKDILALIPEDKNISLEDWLFPKISSKGLYGYVTNNKLIDIGTPERYRMAEKLLNKKLGG